VGRNFDEILRVIDALQLTDRFPVSTPVDWRPGDRLIAAPALDTDEVRERFDNVEEVKPYLRFVDEPAS
jgi:thioredoxin-dependent peroxiredoxin